MRNDGQKTQGGVPRSGRTNGFSFRALSSYLKIVSSGASTVASTVRSAASAASAIVDRDNDASGDQVQWAGFDKLECVGDITRRVLLLGYRFGFQVWDVEEANNVRDLVSKYDGPVSFMQMSPKPIASNRHGDNFADSRPLLVICADGSSPEYDLVNTGFEPTVVRFYSLRSQSYVHMLKFRSVVYTLRCSSRVVAVLQAAQIHCFDAATLEREYTILTNPVVAGFAGSGSIGYGPLAVGPRWLAYSGSPVSLSNSGRVCPQHLSPSVSFSDSASNGSLVAHYAKESSKQLAAGIVTLGDMGYKKLSRYYSELLPDGKNSLQSGNPGLKVNGTVNGHLQDADNVGMVVVRDIVSKSVIAQFKAHKSPISSLCFDPSGTLLVTASVQGHNINVFRILPALSGSSSASDSGTSYMHLYRLQRGFTNAVIQDISFSDDSHWIMVSSSRGTSHLFAISPSGGSVNLQCADACITARSRGSSVMTKPSDHWAPHSGLQVHNQKPFCASGPPITLSVVGRIRNGNNGWRSTVSGAAGAATGRASSLSGAIASAFHKVKGKGSYLDSGSSKEKYHLLVFSPTGFVIQYAFHISPTLDSAKFVSGSSGAYESGPESEERLVVDAIQKWNVCQKQSRRERDDNIDIYGENGNGNSDSNKIFPEGNRKENSIYPEAGDTVTKAKISPQDRHHMYISEAELQMHQARIPLWAKPQIYFQSMMIDDMEMDMENASVGEVEVERIPSRMIEGRSKDLIPVFDYLQTPKVQPARSVRIPAVYSNNSGRQVDQRSGQSENGRLLSRDSSGSLDSVTESGGAVVDLHNGIKESGSNGLRMPTVATQGFVNTNESPKSNTPLENVNNRVSSTVQAQPKFVNNNIEGLKMENQFEDEGDEFD